MNIDEQTLTAYALNELPAEQIAAVEAHLANNAEARATVQSVRDTAAMLSTALANEPGESARLTEMQRERVLAAAVRPPRMRITNRVLIRAAAIAAAAAIGVG